MSIPSLLPRGAVWQQSGNIDLNAFAGQSIYILIESADAGSGSLVEAGVDDLSILVTP
jgi:aminopeptidase S